MSAVHELSYLREELLGSEFAYLLVCKSRGLNIVRSKEYVLLESTEAHILTQFRIRSSLQEVGFKIFKNLLIWNSIVDKVFYNFHSSRNVLRKASNVDAAVDITCRNVE